MAFGYNLISGSGKGTNTDMTKARAAAFDKLINDLFEDINNTFITSQTFTRVDENTKSFDTSNEGYYRESYKLNGVESRYLVIEFDIYSNACISNDYDITIRFRQSNTILKSNTSSVSGGVLSDFYATVRVDYTETTNTLGASEYTYNLSTSFYLIRVYNDNVTLWTMYKDANKKRLINCIGKCTVNDTVFFAYSDRNSTTNARWLVLYDTEGNIYYTESAMLENHNGVDVDGHIVTLPVYLTKGNKATGVICSDYKLEGALQSTPNSCEAGSLYKIGGVDYLSLNSLLIKV